LRMSQAGHALEYTDGIDTYEGYAVVAAGRSGPGPALLIAHDWAGLHEGIKRIAERLATLGYTTLALDVYGKGRRGSPGADNSALMMPVVSDRPRLRERLLAGLGAVRSLPGVDPDRIGILGYCFGGLCALDLARAAPPGLLGAVSFHGLLKAPGIEPQPRITAKTLVLHGWSDPMAPPTDVEAFGREFTAAGADWQLHAYGHAVHAFTVEGANAPENGMAYQPAAARRSWAAMCAFFAEVFGA
jgi:dienelactone hydrolase